MATTKLVNIGPQPGGGAGPNVIDPDDMIVELGGSLNSLRQEVQDAYEDMKTFVNREPDEIMRMASGHSARLSEIRVKCLRVDDWSRLARDLRVRELEPAIDELREQWKNGSRLFSVRELDWKMESGER